MSKKIDPAKMNKGDVVLTGMASFMDSWPIKIGNILHGRFDAIKWTHAAMSLGGLEIIESIPDPGVTIRNIQNTYIDRGIDILVLRCKSLLPERLREAADYCVSKIKESSKYDPRALTYFIFHCINPWGIGWLIDRAGIWNDFFDKYINKEDSYFCSELIAEAFQEVGLPHMKKRKPWQVMPVDFYNTKLFDKIDDIWA